MSILEQTIHFSGQELTLTNQAALFWEREKALVLADLHLGKAAHFRKHGIAVPTQVALKDLERLDNLIRHFKATQVLIVGDLVHAEENQEVALFRNFTLKFPDTLFLLIKGNHDRYAYDTLRGMGICAIHDEWHMAGICFRHQTGATLGSPCISGHIHPGIRMQMPAKASMALPCYVITKNELILPAFSRFTGLDTTPVPGSICYAFFEGGIFKIER